MSFQITPSVIIEYKYCARFTWFEHVLKMPQFEEKEYKVQKGREIHFKKLEENKTYLREKLGVVKKWQDQYLSNELLRGQVDEVLQLEDGSYAPLDYKFSVFDKMVHKPTLLQMYCYAWLIQEKFDGPVNKAFIVYTRSKNRVETIPVLQKHIDEVRQAADSINDIITNNFFPAGVKNKRKCVNCTYRNVCIQ